MVKFCPLFSGSSGNCSYIANGSDGILVDAGVSARAILCALDQIGVSGGNIRGILVTHDHIDHIKGLRVLVKRLKVPVYGTAQTLLQLSAGGFVEPSARLVELQEKNDIADMLVQPFDTPHDAPHSVGFRIEAGERILGYATDLGEVTEEIWQALCGSDLVFLEANYDDAMMHTSPYPYFLKQRICSRRGHLSNADSAACVTRLAVRGTARFVLGHLSQQNNTPVLAQDMVAGALSREGLQAGQDFTLQVARRSRPSEPISF